jgi:drug/metabolite transporter (DMT)-like permease
MWWILQIVGCLAVCGLQVSNRTFGVAFSSWILYVIGSACVTYFAFAYSYALAPLSANGTPNFVLPWMVGQTALNVLGIVVGLAIFKDSVTTQQWIGIALSVLGGYLIIK